MKVLIIIHHRFELWTPPAWFLERLRGEFPSVEFHHFKDYAAAEPHLADADVMVTWSLRAEQFHKVRRLRWIHSTAAAVHALLIPELIASPVVVTNASSIHGSVVGEHAFAMLLAMARHLPSAVRYQQAKTWSQEALWEELPRPREIAGATLGLVGAGAIGAKVAQMAVASGMKLMVVREHPERGVDFLNVPYPTAWPENVSVFGFDGLDEILAESDFLVLAAPVTPKTRLLLDAVRLARMKRDAILINVARGALVDEPALIDALLNRRLGGAALDVFDKEPLPADSPLWALPNVLITPHAAGESEKIWERHYQLLAENLRRFQAGESLLSVIDKQKGY